jgi:hypothetical protein
MPDFSGITVNLGTLIGVAYGLVAVMLVLILYQVLFIVVDLRKIVRRFEGLTTQVEAVILKPLSIADQAMQWVTEYVASKQHAHKRKHHSDDDDAR